MSGCTSADTVSDTELAVPVADDSTEEHEERGVDCLYCIGLSAECHNAEDWIRRAKCFRWAHTLCAGIEDIYFVCLVMDKQCLVLSL